MKVILLSDRDKPALSVNVSIWHLAVLVLLILNSLFAFQFILPSNIKVLQDKNLTPQGGISGVAVEPIHDFFDEDEESALLKSIQFSEKRLAFSKKKIHTIEKKTIAYKAIKKKINYSFLSPVERGFISSNYGMRYDPINGKHRHHKGIDIAGAEGTGINSIASGFVSFVGRKGGYGNVVEIHHSDSLKSRYAHLSQILVEKGDVVRKGELVAEMGSTGRVTGPHLHLEVWKDGVARNPKTYLDLALRSEANN